MSKLVETYNKGSALAVESDDLLQITKLAEQSLKRTHGRPTIYENSDVGLENFWNKATDFFSYINKVNADPDLEKKLIPDIENFCCYMGFTRKTLSEYRKRNDLWSQAIDLIKDSILACKKQLVLTHRLPPLIFIFDSVNNHNYKNVSEFHIAAETNHTADTPRISESQITQLLESDETPQLPE